MSAKTLTFLSRRKTLPAGYSFILDSLPIEQGYLFEQRVDWTDLKRDNPGVEFIGLVGFDTKTQTFVLIAMAGETKNLAHADELSQREQEVLQWVAAGCTNLQIARKLTISENTVKTHLQHIFAKLNVQSRTEAAMQAIQRGWVAG